jgi:hypothetical protein
VQRLCIALFVGVIKKGLKGVQKGIGNVWVYLLRWDKLKAPLLGFPFPSENRLAGRWVYAKLTFWQEVYDLH